MPGNSQAMKDQMAMRDKRAAEDHVGARDNKVVEPAPEPVVEESEEVQEAE